jgi:predicted patatin/cPLA2 family phospholipase
MDVIEVLQSRAKTRSSSDTFHVALVIEGGGMRAVYAAGMAEELQQLGLIPLFDSFHGSSAGALIAAYTIADQADISAQIYCNEATTRDFINVRRIFSRRPVMNIGWMINDVFQKLRPLNIKRVLERGSDLTVIATSLAEFKAVRLSNFSSPAQLLSALEASAFLPIMAGRAKDRDGISLVDGGLSERIGIRSAIDVGATHVLILLTKPQADQRKMALGWKDYFESGLLAIFYGLDTAKLYLRRNKSIDDLFVGMSSDGIAKFEGAHVRAIFPPVSDTNLGRLTTNRVELEKARREGKAAVANLFARRKPDSTV